MLYFVHNNVYSPVACAVVHTHTLNKNRCENLCKTSKSKASDSEGLQIFVYFGDEFVLKWFGPCLRGGTAIV